MTFCRIDGENPLRASCKITVNGMNHKINWDFLGLSGQKEKVTSQGDVTSVRLISVGVPGLEPGKAGPESAVLPLHHIPMFGCFWFIALLRVQRYGLFPKPPNFFPTFFKKQRNISSFITKWLQNLLVSDFCCNFAAVFL